MMDQTNIFWDKLKGEKHLFIVPNAPHGLTPGSYQALSSLNVFVRSLKTKNGPEKRPKFSYSLKEDTGEITVTIPNGYP